MKERNWSKSMKRIKQKLAHQQQNLRNGTERNAINLNGRNARESQIQRYMFK